MYAVGKRCGPVSRAETEKGGPWEGGRARPPRARSTGRVERKRRVTRVSSWNGQSEVGRSGLQAGGGEGQYQRAVVKERVSGLKKSVESRGRAEARRGARWLGK